MITSAGPQCDVCGYFIIFDTSINPFSLNAVPGKTLLCHDKCKPAVEQFMGGVANNPDHWKHLPDGPLRSSFERAMAKAVCND